MGELGELLEALHGPAPRYVTARGTLRTWTDVRGQREAFEAGTGNGGWTAYAVADDVEPSPDEVIGETRFWHRRPDVWRVEGEGRLEIQRGETWWSWSEDEGALSNEDDEVQMTVGGELAPLLEPWRLVAALELEPRGEAEVAGRRALLAAATPRPADPMADDGWVLHQIGFGADAWALAIDRERGTLLRVESCRAGAAFSRSELVEIAFDERLDDDVFVFTSPDGRPARSVIERDTPRAAPLHVVAAAASFTVYAPARVGPDWELEAASTEDYVFLQLRTHERHYVLRITESPVADRSFGFNEEHPDWRVIERGGIELHVIEHSGMHSLAIVRCERDGTRIEMQSESLDLERLVEIALALEPAPAEPPPL